MNRSIKNIVFVPTNKHWGGSELLWSKTAIWFANQEFNVHIIKHNELEFPNWFIDRLKHHQQYIKVELFKKTELSFIKKVCNRFLPYKIRFRSQSKVSEQVQYLKPSLVVINQGFNFNGVELACGLGKLNIKYVLISQALNPGLWPSKLLREKMKLAYTKSVNNYFVSNDNLQMTEMQLGNSLHNAEVVINPFNVPFGKADYAELPNKYHLAVVGRYHFSSKGQDVLLRVLMQEKWKQRNLVVNFYGSGDDEENLKAIIKNFDIGNAVVHGYTDTKMIWQQNQGLILTSRYEGLPIAIVEAMLCKRIVITTDVSGNAELLTDNINSFVAEAPMPKYVDNALERAWAKKDEWKKIGQQAYEDIVKIVPEKPEQVLGQKLMVHLENNETS
ncbi:MAG: hypothetical protein Wins2KO_15320 [Winogradskyella sp.]